MARRLPSARWFEFALAGLVVTFRPSDGTAAARCEDTGEEFARVEGVSSFEHALVQLKAKLIAERPEAWGGRRVDRWMSRRALTEPA